MEKNNPKNKNGSIDKIQNGIFSLKKKNKISFDDENEQENEHEKIEQVLVNENGQQLHHHHHHHHHHTTEKHRKPSKDENEAQDKNAEKKNDNSKEALIRKNSVGPINDLNKRRASKTIQKTSEEQQTQAPITTLTPREIKVTSEKLIKAKSMPHINDNGDEDDDEDEILLVASTNRKEKNIKKQDERPEYASNRNEFLKDGQPMPFWMCEMKKGTEYILKLHKKYGKVEKHELRPTYKADLTKLSLAIACSYNGSDSDSDSDILDTGLKYLKPYDRFFLNHTVELRHGICFCMNKTRNDFQVLNYHGHLMYWVTTQKRCCHHAYTFVDFAGKETLKLEPSRGLPKYKRSYQIYCPVDVLAGTVVQILKCVCSDPEFFVSDENDIKILEFRKIPNKVKASRFGPRFKPDIVFEFKSKRGQGPMGKITTKLADLKRANFTDFDYYGVHIHDDMTCNIKGRIIAAWFVIYLYYYDGKTHKDVHHNLTDAAKKLFEDKKPSVEEIPHDQLEGIIPY